MMQKWTERQIAAYLARVTFSHKHLLLVPNCQWPGSECDLLAVTPNLRIIDIEIKVSRSDLRADAKKDKWFHQWDWRIDGPYPQRGEQKKRRPRQWPRRVWKHYYCLPEQIWTDDLLAVIQPVSGVLLIRDDKYDGFHIRVKRMAKPDRTADKIDAEDAIDIARLASLRMWDAFETLDKQLSWQQGRAA